MKTTMKAELVLCTTDHGDEECDCEPTKVTLEVEGNLFGGSPEVCHSDPGRCAPAEDTEAEVEHVWLLDDKGNQVRELDTHEYDEDAAREALPDDAGSFLDDDFDPPDDY